LRRISRRRNRIPLNNDCVLSALNIEELYNSEKQWRNAQ
jgi:hypothetical protein